MQIVTLSISNAKCIFSFYSSRRFSRDPALKENIPKHKSKPKLNAYNYDSCYSDSKYHGGRHF